MQTRSCLLMWALGQGEEGVEGREEGKEEFEGVIKRY